MGAALEGGDRRRLICRGEGEGRGEGSREFCSGKADFRGIDLKPCLTISPFRGSEKKIKEMGSRDEHVLHTGIQ